jgi:hypothetical protein
MADDGAGAQRPFAPPQHVRETDQSGRLSGLDITAGATWKIGATPGSLNRHLPDACCTEQKLIIAIFQQRLNSRRSIAFDQRPKQDMLIDQQAHSSALESVDHMIRKAPHQNPGIEKSSCWGPLPQKSRCWLTRTSLALSVDHNWTALRAIRAKYVSAHKPGQREGLSDCSERCGFPVLCRVVLNFPLSGGHIAAVIE